MHKKYNGIFGNLVVCVDSFIVYNDGWFAENPEAVKALASMATRGLFYGEVTNGIYTPCDGALVLQLCLQYFKSPTFDNYFADALTNTLTIMKKFKESENLNTVFLGIFLSAFIYNPEATFNYFEEKGILEGVFEELFVNDKKMFHSYQRKLFIVGFGQMLFSDYIPEFISQNLSKIISKMILMLGRLNLTEKFKERRNFIEEAKDGDSEPNRKLKGWKPSEDVLDGDEEFIEDELKEINDYYEAESSGTLLSAPSDGSKAPFRIDRNSENKEEDDKLNDSLDDLDEFDSFDRKFDEKEELEMEYDLIHSKIKDVDENQYFKQVIFKLYSANKEHFDKIMAQLSLKQQDFLQKLLQTQTINIDVNGTQKSVHRRIIKARRRN